MRDSLVPWQTFADSFSETERQVPVPADSEVGRVMAAARESWARDGVPDPDDFTVEPVPFDLD